MNNMTEPSSVRLISCEGEVFVVERSMAVKLNYVKNMMDTMNITSECAIPVGHIDNHTLETIFRFVTYSTTMEGNGNDRQVASWKQNFFIMDDSSLFKLIEAANYLDVPELHELACKRVATIIKKLKTSEAIRARFDIRNDLTPEQQQEAFCDLSFLHTAS